MLRHTLVLPESDARLAAKMLQQAIEALDVVLLLIFGKDDDAERAVQWADQLAARTQVEGGQNLRRVVWLRDTGSVAQQQVLGSVQLAEPLPRMAILNFHDRVRGRIEKGQNFDPLKIELLFLSGQQTERGDQ